MSDATTPAGRHRVWIAILPVTAVLVLGLLLFGPKLKRMASRNDSPAVEHPKPQPVPLEAAERAEGFGAAKWGMSAAEVGKAVGGGMASRQGELMGREVWLSYNYTPAGQLYEVAAVFPTGTDWAAFLEVEAMSHFNAQYGTPQQDSAQDGQGAGLSRWMWKGPHTLVEAVLDRPADGPAGLKILFRSPALAALMHQQDVEAELLKARKTLKGFKD